MSDAKQNPSATPDRNPKKQTGEDKGPIKGPQVTEHNVEETDTPAGAEGDIRRGSVGAR